MESPPPLDRTVIAGYAAGMGLVFVATLGVFWQFWQPGHSVWIWGLGSFAIGAAVGAGWAYARRVRL
jgi:hypothetical protein